ncbi:MAG: hypothetical protein ACSHX7_11310 [Luteolibacter sp.]
MAYALLDDAGQKVLFEASSCLESQLNDPGAKVSVSLLGLLRSRPEIGEALTKIMRLPENQRNQILDCQDKRYKEEEFAQESTWIIDDLFNLQTCMLTCSYQMQELDGNGLLRVANVASTLERLGKKVSNPARVIRQYANPEIGFVKILEEASGQASIGYRLTEAGIREGKRLFDSVSNLPPAKIHILK